MNASKPTLQSLTGSTDNCWQKSGELFRFIILIVASYRAWRFFFIAPCLGSMTWCALCLVLLGGFIIRICPSLTIETVQSFSKQSFDYPFVELDYTLGY